MKQALGMIEITGFSTAVMVADTMVKAANIQVLDIENTKGLGYMTIKIVGDVGAVNAAISTGKSQAISYGHHVNSVVISRPHYEIYDIIQSKEATKKEEVDDKTLEKEKVVNEEVEKEDIEDEETKSVIDEEKLSENEQENAEDIVILNSEYDMLEEIEKYDAKKNKSTKKVKNNKKK